MSVDYHKQRVAIKRMVRRIEADCEFIKAVLNRIVPEMLSIGLTVEQLRSKKQMPKVSDSATLRRVMAFYGRHRQQVEQHGVNPNLVREGILALQLVPPKRWLKIDGDVQFRPKPTHLAILRRYREWKNAFTKQHGRGPTAEETGIVLRDLRPMLEDFANVGNPHPR